MPKYEFVCEECHKYFACTFSYREYDKKELICPACSSKKIDRRIGRVSIARSESTRFDDLSELADSHRTDQLENDPQELGRIMRKMGSEIGKDIGPQFNDVVDRLEYGQTPDEIEKSMPDLDDYPGEE